MIEHKEFSTAWSACADADYINDEDMKIVFSFLRKVHEEAYICAVDTCSLCEKEHGQAWAPYRRI